MTGRLSLTLPTGAAQGIGYEVATALRESGATVVIVDREAEGAAAAAERLGVEYAVLDVTNSVRVEEAFRLIAEKHGRLDVVVNNAGTVLNAPAEDETDEDWRRVMAVNLDGVFWCCRAAGRIMLPQGFGAIVNTASMSAKIVNTPQKQASYNTSKAGVVALTKCLAVEWADRGVRVNAIAPGYSATPLLKAVEDRNPVWYQKWIDATPLHRAAEPKEIAPAVVFLASDAASYVTGETLVIDGGYTLL